MCDLMSDLVICKVRKSVVIHDTECPYWDQVSFNNTQTQPNPLCFSNCLLQCSFTYFCVILQWYWGYCYIQVSKVSVLGHFRNLSSCHACPSNWMSFSPSVRFQNSWLNTWSLQDHLFSNMSFRPNQNDPIPHYGQIYCNQHSFASIGRASQV